MASAFSLLLLFSLYTAIAAADLPPVHDYLPSYGLPKGLLPSSVVNYSLSDNGEFIVELAAPCYVQFTDLVHYDRVVKGKLSYGAVTQISGIQAKKLFVWFSLTGLVLTADRSQIEFQVGIFYEKLPISLFVEIPDCGKKVSAVAES